MSQQVSYFVFYFQSVLFSPEHYAESESDILRFPDCLGFYPVYLKGLESQTFRTARLLDIKQKPFFY